jgi:hypothetical protein
MLKKFVLIGGLISIIGVVPVFFFFPNFFAVGSVTGLPGGIKDMEVHGDFAYICDESLTIIDISNPSTPYIYKIIDMLNPQWISCQHGFLFLQEGDGNLQIVDISNPYNPEVVEMLSQGGTVALRDDFLYSVRSPNTMLSGEFAVYNFSSPSNPRLISERSPVTSWSKDFKIKDNFGYIAGGPALLTVVNLKNPQNISIASTYFDEGIGRHAGQSIEIYGDVAFITDYFDNFSEDPYKYNHNLYALNISNPHVPELIWKIDSRDIEKVWIESDLLFCTSSKDGFFVYNLSDFLNPTLIYTYNPPISYINAVEIHEEYVYLLGYIMGINRFLILDKNSLIE